MTTPFVAQFRSRRDIVRLGADGESVITVRVEVPEVWDTVRIDAPPSTSVAAIKDCALAVLSSNVDPNEYVIKINGWEVLDEDMALTEAGAKNGSIFLCTGRRRRPVR
jgi:hypothetical protein